MLSQKEHACNDAEKQTKREKNELIGMRKMSSNNTHRKKEFPP